MNRCRISKRKWYGLGGFANPRLFRKQARNGSWAYYQVVE